MKKTVFLSWWELPGFRVPVVNARAPPAFCALPYVACLLSFLVFGPFLVSFPSSFLFNLIHWIHLSTQVFPCICLLFSGWGVQLVQKPREVTGILKVTQHLGILVQCLFLLLNFLVFPISHI